MTLYFYEHNAALFTMGILFGMFIAVIIFAFIVPKDNEDSIKTIKPRKSFHELLELIRNKIKEDLSK